MLVAQSHAALTEDFLCARDMVTGIDCPAQVSELEGIFSMLDADVNGLLMTGPPVALDELYQAEGQAQAALSDQASLLQVHQPAPEARKQRKDRFRPLP